ncbi:Protein phosphatase 1L [Lunasporangiospora selenospora]|uniref:Protein phosphatase 1L n=1 Tax=Lunasporangiospora selenospora TaxID=979761 RepID=A0A9P6FU41_9FUNG|nr:Protein phosphatase 1L [Lunasporangiospora selenospora]
MLTPLPRLQDYNLLPDQLKNPLFVAIAKVLLVWGNIWQSATQLVEGIRHFNQANLGGRTPKGTVQGAISTAIALSGTLRTFEPIEKLRLGSTTYYRMDRRVFETRAPPTVAPDSSDSDEETTSAASSRRGRRSGGASRAPVSKTKSKPAAAPSSSTAAATSRARRPPKPTITTAAIRSTATTTSQDATNKRKKKTPLSPGWGSDTLSSDSSDEEDTPQNMSRSSYGRGSSSNHSYYNSSAPGSKRTRTGSPDAGPSGSSTRGRPPGRRDSIPNGLKKLPKGYVYDMEINQAALMHLSVNPSQTGEYMQHLKGKNAIANDFPDRRGEFNVDLNQEPSIFSMEQQTGYTYPRLRTSMKERLSKAECEDGYAIADLKHDGSYLGRLFCITDGHGGRACSSFVIATIPGALQVILGKYKPSDLSLPRVQELVRRQITEAVRLIDKEYLDYKKQQYLLYKAKKIVNDPGSDGTTLIVNVFVDKWIICLNLGDSRTMLGSRDSNGRWGVHFHSEDHTPSLERLAQTIYANGGEFVTHDDKIIKFDPNMKNDKKHRYGLKEARIRVRDGASNEYGIPFRTKNGQCASVNLGACIGDVLYKLDPVNPVLSCKPDITFIDTTEIQQGFLLMATDGLWDYVQRGGKVQEQTATVCQFVGDKLDRGWNHQRIVCTLSDRESVASLYSDSIQEFDDFTAILVTFSKQQLLHQQQQRQEYERQQLILQQQRIQEQQILLLQQQHQKQLEQERQLRQEQESKKLEEEKEESKAHGPLEPSPVTEMNGSHGVKIKVEDDGGKAMNLGGGGGSDGGGSLVPEQAPKHSPLLLIKTAPASDEETESDSEWTSTGIRRPLPVQRQAMVHVEVMDTKSTESTKTSSGSVPPPALSPTFSATGTMSDVPTSPTT